MGRCCATISRISNQESGVSERRNFQHGRSRVDPDLPPLATKWRTRFYAGFVPGTDISRLMLRVTAAGWPLIKKAPSQKTLPRWGRLSAHADSMTAL